MDAASRRPQLAALSYLDIDKNKREDGAYSLNIGGRPGRETDMPASPYPSGPPPPYSRPQLYHASSWSDLKTELQTPSELRQTSVGEREREHENGKLHSRQSLPSLSEALGVESQTSYSQLPSANQAPPHSAAPSSPSPMKRPSFGIEPPPSSHNPYQYSFFRQDSAGPPSYSSSSEPKAASAPTSDLRTPLHAQTSTSTSQNSRHQTSDRPSYPQTTSPQYEQSSSHMTASMGPPSLPYGYSAYTSKYTQPTPPPSASAGPIYSPSTHYGPPSTTPNWRSDGTVSRYGSDDRASAPVNYGESVKRHLDLYDLEQALSEIANTSNIMLDFSRRYGDRMHQSARSEPSLSTLPSLVEVDDMIAKSRVQQDSLNKIREVITAQQIAYDQQIAEQRQQRKVYHEPPPPLPVAHQVEEEDSKGNFATPDAKKRRGRAAPPGRCHSCNRAETPEWRRGPDGARTLCNACGLHYAKLTRKQSSASKAPSVGTSNLRPKES